MKKLILPACMVLLMNVGYGQMNQVAAGPASATDKKSQHRVVIQLSSNDTLAWKGLMNNLKNLKAGWGSQVQVEVVAHGPGIEMLMINKTTQQKKIAEFKAIGIVFVGCENTIRERKIDPNLVIPEAGLVPMGIGEVILKQEQGWSYIKAGF